MELNYKELVALAVPAAFLFGAAAFPAGWFGDRWSKTKLLGIYLCGWIFDLTGSFIWLYGLLVLLAIGVAIIAFLFP